MTVCDRCGTPCAERGWLAINKDGRELVLCHVHRREHEAALIKQGWALIELAANLIGFPTEVVRRATEVGA